MARKISDVTIDQSNRYAVDKATFAEDLIQKAPPGSSIQSNDPNYRSEFDNLWSPRQVASWGHFTKYKESGNLFTSEGVIPSLGSEDLRDIKKEATISELGTLQGQRRALDPSNWQEKQKLDKSLYEAKSIIGVFDTLTPLDKDIAMCKSKQNTHHKG
ncbi:MAG: hypothetical protein SP1CHLAM54_01080 [Chlamydiia bacterium]|nr:hypothetical protein [Chlamydiia bacterium]MCH9615030.1 hypothetical protein [Chlamydiia bacterium]MCH9629919.1 hypothetical protein [Chlamydiia bacterium]